MIRKLLGSEDGCKHVEEIQVVTPSGDGCVECLKTGDQWVHLRLCMTCGHVGCCDSSKNQHATGHSRALRHPILRSFEPGESWGWCTVDEIPFDAADWVVNGPVAHGQ